MLDVRIYDCKECEDVSFTLKALDARIAFLSGKAYNSISYLSPINYHMREVKNLLYYKNILSNLFWNSSFYNKEYKTIISKVKSLL